MSGAFAIESRSAAPATVGPTDVRLVDQYGWLQLTVGRFLAPAVYDETTGVVSYLLDGDRSAVIPGRIASEAAAFAAMLDRLESHLGDLIDARVDCTRTLLSLQALVELRLPEPGTSNFHFVDGLIVCTGWGLDSGVRLGDLLGPENGDQRGAFLEGLRGEIRSLSQDEEEAFVDRAPEPGTDVPDGSQSLSPPVERPAAARRPRSSERAAQREVPRRRGPVANLLRSVAGWFGFGGARAPKAKKRKKSTKSARAGAGASDVPNE